MYGKSSHYARRSNARRRGSEAEKRLGHRGSICGLVSEVWDDTVSTRRCKEPAIGAEM